MVQYPSERSRPNKPGEIIELRTCVKESRPYYFGYKIEESLIKKLREYEFDRLFFYTEKNLIESFGKSLFESIRAEYPCELTLLPSGEHCKHFPVLEKTLVDLTEKGASKKSMLIAFGGGTVGNLVGLSAGLLYRGVRFIEVPTSITGQSDNVLSNKQGINGKNGKNHFGFYHAPLFVWGDTQYLATEPLNSKRSGIVEGIKNGFISDPDFLDYMENVLNPDVNYSDAELTDLVYRVILSKLPILQRDPTERVYGAILEYGHTFGHALEWLMGGEMFHGEAISHGLRIAARLSRRLGLIDQAVVERHDYLIVEKLGFSQPFPVGITAQKMIETMRSDNKKTGPDLRFVLLKKTGECHNPEGDWLVTVDDAIVEEILEEFIGAK